jgi:predicted nucleic acid-binding protein
MNGTTVYLDSSAIAKRYLGEEGADVLDALYRRAESRAVSISFSMWNIGEVLRAIARARQTDWISERDARAAAWLFVQETLKLRGLGGLRLAALRGDLLASAVPLLFRRGLTQPDALQIVTCKDVGGTVLVSSDVKLLRAAMEEGLDAADPLEDADRLRSL